MASATLEKPDLLVADRETAHVFLARRQELKLVITRRWDRRDQEGNIVETIMGQHVAFTDGVLRVPASGRMRGEHGEDLDAGEVLTFLRGDPATNRLPHHLFGDRFDGFWEHDEPAPAPSQEETDKLTELGMELDVAGLERFIAQEEERWARPKLLESARGTLERVQVKLAEQEKAVAAAREEGAKATPKGKEA